MEPKDTRKYTVKIEKFHGSVAIKNKCSKITRTLYPSNKLLLAIKLNTKQS